MTVTTSSPAVQTLDNRGRDCASGFIKLLEIMDTLSTGETLLILSTDPASQRELRERVNQAGHKLMEAKKSGPLWDREYHYLIQKEGA
jgi:TusA-related sulfurtransferase